METKDCATLCRGWGGYAYKKYQENEYKCPSKIEVYIENCSFQKQLNLIEIPYLIYNNVRYMDISTYGISKQKLTLFLQKEAHSLIIYLKESYCFLLIIFTLKRFKRKIKFILH